VFLFPVDGVRIHPSAAGLLRQAEGCPSEPTTGDTGEDAASRNYFWHGCHSSHMMDLATAVDLFRSYALPQLRSSVRVWARVTDVGADDVLTVHIRHGDIMDAKKYKSLR
jgi:hypothetical protein